MSGLLLGMGQHSYRVEKYGGKNSGLFYAVEYIDGKRVGFVEGTPTSDFRTVAFWRNSKIVEVPTIAFWDGKSTGTADSITKAQENGTLLKIYYPGDGQVN